jgi:hypothetical protein
MAEMGAPLDRFAEVETGEAFTVQNPRLLKVELSATGVLAKNGSMVAFRRQRVGAGAALGGPPRRAGIAVRPLCAGVYARQ